MQTKLVVMGATALLILLGDLRRFTRDLDLTVALDLNEFDQLTHQLARIGWKPSPRLEHRWIAPRQTIVDLLPAGPILRRQGAITWPVSQFTMSTKRMAIACSQTRYLTRNFQTSNLPLRFS